MKPPFVIFWLPGRDAHQNFFTYNFVFSFLHASQSIKGKPFKNQTVKSKKRLDHGDLLALALEWKKGLEEGRYASRAAIARAHAISRARGTQIMNILRFPTELFQGKMEAVTERRIIAILHGPIRDL